jgi:hypothetical protein
MADPNAGGLTKSKTILDQVMASLLEIRNNTPVGSYDDDENFFALKQQVGALGDQIDEARALAGADIDFVSTVVFPVQFLYDAVDYDLITGQLPRSPDDPRGLADKDPLLLTQESMRQEAAEAEAEPATNGYDQSSKGGA